MFPDGFMHETQLSCNVLSYDGTYDPDVLGIVGCGAALSLSGIPFDASGRCSRGHGRRRVRHQPSFEELDRSELDLVIAGTADSVVMVEGAGEEVSSNLMGAMEAGQKAIAEICAAVADMAREVGKPPMEWQRPIEDSALEQRVRERAEPRVREAMRIADKEERNRSLDRIQEDVSASIEAELGDAFAERTSLVKDALKSTEKSVMRVQIVDENVRADGRSARTFGRSRSRSGSFRARTAPRCSPAAARSLWEPSRWARSRTSR